MHLPSIKNFKGMVSVVIRTILEFIAPSESSSPTKQYRCFQKIHFQLANLLRKPPLTIRNLHNSARCHLAEFAEAALHDILPINDPRLGAPLYPDSAVGGVDCRRPFAANGSVAWRRLRRRPLLRRVPHPPRV